MIETIPYRWYSDPEQLRREQERVFARSWQYVGRADEVTEPGSFTTGRCGDVPVLVVRDGAGVLRGFLNVCRHRGSTLLEGAGSRRSIQCPYHAWTYGLDGGLLAAPRTEREPGFDPAEHSLAPVAVDTWGPFLFANPDAGAAPLADALGALPELLARVLDLGALRFHSRARFGVEANWKVAVENFLECYHCATVHPEFAAQVDVHPDRYVLEPHPTFAAQACRARDGGGAGQFHLLYPNTGINVFPGTPNLSIGPLLPAGPDRTERFLDYFFAEDADPEWIAEFLAYDDRIGREDAAMVESVHRGMRSGLLEHGSLLGESEQLITAFQGWLRGQLDG